jgi:hypothetical protein
MSYLNNVRLIFHGTFQADVSTVNNDVRHYDNAHWEDRFQDFQKPDGTEDGWWNPIGSGAFRLIGCRISSVHYRDGTSAVTAEQDPAVGLTIGGANERVAAKLVDLDPQWQMASQIWGLEVRLVGDKEVPLAHGRFLHSAFRDLTFSRIHGSGGDGGASSSFQSVLQGLTWSAEASNSRALRELKDSSASDSLSIRLMTFGFVFRYGEPRFSLGTVCGAIGPYIENEPKSFVLGRRFVAADVKAGQSWNGVNYFSGAVDEGSPALFLDLANALQLTDTTGAVRDIGTLRVGVLRDPSLGEQAAVTPANFLPLGEINYRAPNWLFDTSGVYALPLDPQQLKIVLAAPLALAAEQPAGTNLIAIRENNNGLFCCADDFVQRIDAPGKSTAVIHTAQYGRPLPGAKITLRLQPPQSGVGGGDAKAPNQPQAVIPDIGTPPDGLSFPATLITDADGRAGVEIAAKALEKPPRGYIDGQIYLISYGIDGEPTNAHPQYDFIVVHARDTFDAPAKPTWISDIAPILTQYGNLYPIMSQRLVDLSDPDSIRRNLKILQLAFSLDIEDPNYMPVTRDLSAGKRLAIQRWLARLELEDDPTFVGGPRVRSELIAGAEVAAARVASSAVEPLGGKTSFARTLNAARRPPGGA